MSSSIRDVLVPLKNIKEYASKKKYASYRIELEKLPQQVSSLPVDYQLPTGTIGGHNETKRNETETETLKALSAEPTPDVISPKKLSEIWNESAPDYLPRVISMSDKRIKKLKRHINGQSDIEWWKRLFKDIDLSPFYSGKDGKWSGMDFDWAVVKHEHLRQKLDRASHFQSQTPINKADAVTLGNLRAGENLLKKYEERGE